MNSKIFPLLFLSISLAVGCGNFPRDPEQSFDNARADKLRVGLVNNPPYVSQNNGDKSGVEVQLIEDFAHRNNLEIYYITDSESNLIEELEKYKLHIVAGGFKKNTIWSSSAGISLSYDSQHVLLVPKGENKLLYKLEKFIIEN